MGFKVRLIVQSLEASQHSSKLLNGLQEESNFKVRFFIGRTPACLAIYDLEVRISVARDVDVYSVSAYWSNNQVLIALAKSYFESILHEEKGNVTRQNSKKNLGKVEPRAGFAPAACCLRGSRSAGLSYRGAISAAVNCDDEELFKC
jgi:hypothetical protein